MINHKVSAIDLWAAYKKINPDISDKFGSFQFGGAPDLLASLVSLHIKTATSSGYELYKLENEPLPMVGSYDVVLDSKNNAICIIKTISVNLVAFGQVSSEHAFKEGEGDRSLEYWRKVHLDFFSPYYKEAGLSFTEDSPLVLEEFECVFSIEDMR